MAVRSHLAAMFLGAAIALVTPTSAVIAAPSEKSAEMTNLLDYLRNQNSTGLLVIQDGKILVEKYWPAPEGDAQYPLFVYGKANDGSLLEDVASQQKSFVSVLVAVAIDKGLLDVTKPVSDYIGAGWSKASPEQEAAIRVIDHGPGVEPAERDRIFEPFQRGARSERPGAGLGLAIARGFAEANGGSLSVESRAGQGATFVLRFPVAERPQAMKIAPVAGIAPMAILGLLRMRRRGALPARGCGPSMRALAISE